MKKIYLSPFSFLLALFSIQAQNAITITESSIVSNNQFAQLFTDTSLSAYTNSEAVKSGADVNWDLSDLSNDVVKDLTFTDPASLNDYSLFSNANLGLQVSPDNFDIYFNKTANEFAIEGIVGDVAGLGVVLKAKMSPAQTLVTFPSTYQTTFNTVSKASASAYHGQTESFVYNNVYYTFFVDSFKAEYTYNISSEIDGYGTLTTPVGTFKALKQKVQEVQVDTHYAYVQGVGWYPFEYETITEYKLRWWVDGLGYPAVEGEYNPGNNKVNNVNYLSQAISLNAITITESSIITANQTVKLMSDTAITASVNSQATQTGMDVTWDLSNLTPDLEKTLTFTDPANLKDYSFFPQSNLGLQISPDSFDVYFNLSSAALAVEGIVGDVMDLGVELKAKMSPAQTIISFPSTYQTTFNTVSEASASVYYGQNESFVYNGLYYTFFVDSFKAEYTYNISSEIDGYGTLITPTGSFQALRQKVQEVQVDTNYAYIQGVGWYPFEYTTITEYKLRWWVDGLGYPAVECEYNPVNDKVSNLNYLSSPVVIVTDMKEISSNMETVNVYPNPATENITFNGFNEDAKTIEIYDITGKIVKRFETNAANQATIPVSDLNNGFYTYSVLKETKERLTEGKLSILK
jgi:multidrug transporter EmrE-like cation transporter